MVDDTVSLYFVTVDNLYTCGIDRIGLLLVFLLMTIYIPVALILLGFILSSQLYVFVLKAAWCVSYFAFSYILHEMA